MKQHPMNNKSTNNPWLVFLTWGESLHNNHHYRPKKVKSTLNGMNWT